MTPTQKALLAIFSKLNREQRRNLRFHAKTGSHVLVGPVPATSMSGTGPGDLWPYASRVTWVR